MTSLLLYWYMTREIWGGHEPDPPASAPPILGLGVSIFFITHLQGIQNGYFFMRAILVSEKRFVFWPKLMHYIFSSLFCKIVFYPHFRLYFLLTSFYDSHWVQCFVEKMNFQASMHQTEKTLKYAIRQKGPHPPNSSLKQAAQKQLTTKKRKEGRGVKKGMHFMFLAWIFSTKHSKQVDVNRPKRVIDVIC